MLDDLRSGSVGGRGPTRTWSSGPSRLRASPVLQLEGGESIAPEPAPSTRVTRTVRRGDAPRPVLHLPAPLPAPQTCRLQGRGLGGSWVSATRSGPSWPASIGWYQFSLSWILRASTP